jgi:hypothetical protein
MNDYPVFWPDITPDSDPNHPISEGDYLSMDGVVSGYLYNMFSTSKNRIAQFTAQTIGNKTELYTITCKNGTTLPDEYAMPTKRLIYQDCRSDVSSYQWTFNDYAHLDGNGNVVLVGTFDIITPSQTDSVNLNDRYISYNSQANFMVVSDSRSSFTESLYPTAKFGIPENTVVSPTSSLSHIFKFSGIQANTVYQLYYTIEISGTISRAANPIYQKVYNNSPEIPSAMYHGPIPSITPATPIGDILSVYAIGYTEDGEYRAISPTYEVSKVFINWEVDGSNPNKINISFRVIDDNIHDYYIKHFPFSFIVTYYVTDGDGNTSQQEYTTATIAVNWDDITPSGGYKEWQSSITVPDLGISPTLYVKDVTGIRRVTQTY